MAEDKIRAMFIFEILGKPAEHIKKTMEDFIDKLMELPGIEVSNRKVHEPKKFEKDPSLFTTFAEVEVLGKDINNIIALVFYGMPSHVEIIEPEQLILKNFDLSSLLSTLTTKLHRYDEIAKAITIERNILINKLKELQGKIKVEKPKTKKDKKATKTKKKKARKNKKK